MKYLILYITLIGCLGLNYKKPGKSLLIQYEYQHSRTIIITNDSVRVYSVIEGKLKENLLLKTSLDKCPVLKNIYSMTHKDWDKQKRNNDRCSGIPIYVQLKEDCLGYKYNLVISESNQTFTELYHQINSDQFLN